MAGLTGRSIWPRSQSYRWWTILDGRYHSTDRLGPLLGGAADPVESLEFGPGSLCILLSSGARVSACNGEVHLRAVRRQLQTDFQLLDGSLLLTIFQQDA